ncbi:ecto-ADP-ribosyltransferase 5 [Brachionichthys hirsutus]|uniref:ecto-ADP-ribosyltransferase 5 n=1 Tax=Brachionichthys hirsutus TaxID=412623 RepID=UPI003604EA67
MWNKGNLLLSASISVALFCTATAEHVNALDMAKDAVDDIYSGCREQALKKFIHSGLLKQELNHSKAFNNAWSQKDQCSKIMPGKAEENTAALSTYASGGEDFINAFNNAVKTLGANESIYESYFHFKSFHFLLMDSMMLLPPEKCQTMYVVHEEKYTAKKGSKVRFGTFFKVHSSSSVLTDYDLDGQVVFNITSCFFANLGANICTDEDAALLSPAEMFTVEDVKEVSDADRTEYTEIILRHSDVVASHNCYMFSRSPARVSSQWLVTLLMVLTLQ